MLAICSAADPRPNSYEWGPGPTEQHWRCAVPGTRGEERSSDVIRLQRREAVEGDGRVSRRIRARSLDQHLVADLQADRQVVRLLLVHHVNRVAGRAGKHAGAEPVAVAWGLDRIPD